MVSSRVCNVEVPVCDQARYWSVLVLSLIILSLFHPGYNLLPLMFWTSSFLFSRFPSALFFTDSFWWLHLSIWFYILFIFIVALYSSLYFLYVHTHSFQETYPPPHHTTWFSLHFLTMKIFTISLLLSVQIYISCLGLYYIIIFGFIGLFNIWNYFAFICLLIRM